MGAFDGVDWAGFWDDGDYSRTTYTEPAPSDALVAEIEAELGVRLPAAYVELARLRNGGGVERGWIGGIYAIGRTARHSLCGAAGSAFWQQEWGYPAIGVCFADTPSAGHEQYVLDYRDCGPGGEPRVVHVDQERDYAITPVADDFAAFVHGLLAAEDDEEAEAAEQLADDLDTVQHGTLSPVVQRAIAAAGVPEAERWIRRLGERIVRDKGFFALHADPQSFLMYDAMFWLYGHLATATSRDDFVHRAEGQTGYDRPCYELMVPTTFVAEPYGFTTAGWAPGFLDDWWDHRTEAEAIVAVDGGFRFAPAYATQLVRVLGAL